MEIRKGTLVVVRNEDPALGPTIGIVIAKSVNGKIFNVRTAKNGQKIIGEAKEENLIALAQDCDRFEDPEEAILGNIVEIIINLAVETADAGTYV